MTYEELLIESDHNNLITKEKPLRANKGRIKNNRIAIKKDLTETEKACVLAEELGHYYTSTGDILDQSNVSNRKQERRARVWAYQKAFGLQDLITAYKYGCKNQFEIAEYLNITEDFLKEALVYYHCRYGSHIKIDRYLIYFSPLGILELYK